MRGDEREEVRGGERELKREEVRGGEREEVRGSERELRKNLAAAHPSMIVPLSNVQCSH